MRPTDCSKLLRVVSISLTADTPYTMKRNYPLPLSDIISGALQEHNLEDKMLMYRASAAWPCVVGPMINANTVMRRVDAGVLYVRILSAVIRQEVSINRSHIMGALNRCAGANVIFDIKFV